LFTISILIQYENYIGKTVFIKSIELVDKGEKAILITHKGKHLTLLVKNLKKAINDERVYQSNSLSHQQFIIFTSIDRKEVFHLPRSGIFINEDFLDDVVDGKFKLPN